MRPIVAPMHLIFINDKMQMVVC